MTLTGDAIGTPSRHQTS